MLYFIILKGHKSLILITQIFSEHLQVIATLNKFFSTDS